MTIDNGSHKKPTEDKAGAIQKKREDLLAKHLRELAGTLMSSVHSVDTLFSKAGIADSKAEPSLVHLVDTLFSTVSGVDYEGGKYSESFLRRAEPYYLPVRIQWSAFRKIVETVFSPPLREGLYFYDVCLKADLVVISGQAFCECIMSAYGMARDNGQDDIALVLGTIDHAVSAQLTEVAAKAEPFKIWVSMLEFSEPEEAGEEYSKLREWWETCFQAKQEYYSAEEIATELTKSGFKISGQRVRDRLGEMAERNLIHQKEAQKQWRIAAEDKPKVIKYITSKSENRMP